MLPKGKSVQVNDFSVWILDEVNKRGWTPAELAKRAGINTGTLSRVLNGTRNPGPDLCLAVAKALGEPPEKIFRLAGLLPILPAGEEDQTLKEILDIAKNMSPENRQDLLSYARYRYQQEQEKKRK